MGFIEFSHSTLGVTIISNAIHHYDAESLSKVTNNIFYYNTLPNLLEYEPTQNHRLAYSNICQL